MNPEEYLMNTLNPVVIDRHVVAPRPARCAPIPGAFANGAIGTWLDKMTAGRGELWLHQSKALEFIASGSNTVVATPTASGKTLIFQAAVIQMLLENRDRTFAVFLPQKALSSNQVKRWKAAVALAGLPENEIGEINGDVPAAEREEILQRARVVLVTPDIVHSSFLRQLAQPNVRHFIRNLGMIAIDEAHNLEGVFGSNCAFFFRRLRSARRRLRSADGLPETELQIVAASATIADPAGHLAALTGQEFEVVSESDNGAPFPGLTLLHLEGPDHGAAGEAMLSECVGQIARTIPVEHAAIAFADSRQGVERITAGINMDEVEPYRAGLERDDRAAIEEALDAGQLRAVVSTSALELGVDIPQFTVGLNLGVPQTRKSFKQRSGRAGRASEAVFAIIAPGSAFAKLGTTLREFYEDPAEGSALYLSNPMIQFQHASCLFEECGAGDELELPGGIDWPDGFDKAFGWARPGAMRPREIEQLAAQSTGDPHRDYPLRQVGMVEFALRDASTGAPLGTINIEKAIREAYPGAIVYQRKRPYRVIDWRQTGYERVILLQSIPGGPRTMPLISTRISVSHQDSELQEARLVSGSRGSLAEIRLQVNEAVLGYVSGSKQLFYAELAKLDRRKTKKQRNYSTTGVLIRIDEPWFNGQGGAAAKVREHVAHALSTILTRERSIAPGDIRSAHSGIAMHGRSGPQAINDAIVIYDDAAGGLRLTEPLFADIEHFLERLRRGVELAGTDALLEEAAVARLERWQQDLRPANTVEEAAQACPAGEIMIYAPGSIVGVRINGALVERELLGHNIVDFAGSKFLGYFYNSQPGVSSIIPHDQIEAIGHEWRQVLWDPQVNEIREIAA